MYSEVVVFENGNEVTYRVPVKDVYLQPSSEALRKRQGVYGRHGTLAVLDSLQKVVKNGVQ